MYCTYCNFKNTLGNKYCESCGKSLEGMDSRSATPIVDESKQETKGTPRKWLLLLIMFILLIGAGYAIWSYVFSGPKGVFQSSDIPMASNIRPGEMVVVPAGEFQMGCNQKNPNGNCNAGELPLHTIYLDEYRIHKYEVTNDQYARFLNERESNSCGGGECVELNSGDSRLSLRGGQYVVETGYEDHPVTYISWYGANSFCIESGNRLPSEAEWEKAARGSDDPRVYPWGNQPPDCNRGNFYFSDGEGYCVGETAPVGSFPKGVSPYGAFNMVGNVSEWVNDWYSEEYYEVSPKSNPPGPDSGTGKGDRGGSWDVENWKAISVGDRSFQRPSVTDSYFVIGFRCAADASG